MSGAVRHMMLRAPRLAALPCSFNQRCQVPVSAVMRSSTLLPAAVTGTLFYSAAHGPLSARCPPHQRLTPCRQSSSSSSSSFSSATGGHQGSPGTPSSGLRFTAPPSSTPGGSGIADHLLQSSAPPSSEEQDKEEQRRRESSWRAMKYTFAFFGVTSAFFAGWAIIVFGAPPRDPDDNEMEDEFSQLSTVQQYLRRSWREIKLYNKMIKDPSRDLLLPDPLQYPYQQPPYTLVLELTGVLVHPDWTYKTGWRFKKRPGIAFFLQQIGPPLFEVVIFTAEQGFTAHPIVDALDPQGYVMYRLYKDSTRYLDNHHVKDLNCLNRDLSKVIMVDWDEQSVKLNPRNQLRVAKWTGDDDDRSLIDLAMLLKAIATSGVSDIREVMDHYRQFDDPLQAFRDNQRILQEQEAALMRQKSADEGNVSLAKRKWMSGFLR